jgi:hypothetical protein
VGTSLKESVKNAKILAMFTDYGAFKPNRMHMMESRQIENDSGINYSSDENDRKSYLDVESSIYKQEILSVPAEELLFENWHNFDLKTLIHLIVLMYQKSNRAPSDKNDLGVALKDFDSLILNPAKRPVDIRYVSNHFLLQSELEAHSMIFSTAMTIGHSKWYNHFTKEDISKLNRAGVKLLESTFNMDWRSNFRIIQTLTLQSTFALEGPSYKRFFAFAFIVLKHIKDDEDIYDAFHREYNINTDNDEDLQQQMSKILRMEMPMLRLFCYETQDIIKKAKMLSPTIQGPANQDPANQAIQNE